MTFMVKVNMYNLPLVAGCMEASMYLTHCTEKSKYLDLCFIIFISVSLYVHVKHTSSLQDSESAEIKLLV